MLNFYKSVVLKRQAHLQSGQLARWKMSGMRSYNPEQIMLSAVVRRPSRDVNLMKEKLIFSEINNGVGSTDELSAYTGNGLGAYARDDIMTPARHAMKL
ncbi:glycerophosphodiester phosphodiesterase domain-containing protein 5-like isoform X2 [Labeo rohita]|nr:glycerophosphodiester phosphodiesterase domain-containing protein 5-like isoform X2 [Labeo rohita]XP_050957839.1 glycerophosphodiester phosphodiesterase domain-containing protein 5-like isoform X2 [Labeo rohita]XP_050957840.1 glycerophosphodiester phosphodiesterase domain-containing protein 5-like isoform X2 [Labeo rohita]